MGKLTICLIIILGLIIIGAGTSATLSNMATGAQKIADDPNVQEITEQINEKLKSTGQDLAKKAIAEISQKMESGQQ